VEGVEMGGLAGACWAMAGPTAATPITSESANFFSIGNLLEVLILRI
jgi:hypothetical protein